LKDEYNDNYVNGLNKYDGSVYVIYNRHLKASTIRKNNKDKKKKVNYKYFGLLKVKQIMTSNEMVMKNDVINHPLKLKLLGTELKSINLLFNYKNNIPESDQS